jgi:hypothetical protein
MQSIGVLIEERRPKAAYGHLLPQGEKGRKWSLTTIYPLPAVAIFSTHHMVIIM